MSFFNTDIYSKIFISHVISNNISKYVFQKKKHIVLELFKGI